MPKLTDSIMKPDSVRYKPVSPRPVGGPVSAAPDLPSYMQQSTVMISSLPNISTNATDSVLRQFYPSSNLPTRRLILPN